MLKIFFQKNKLLLTLVLIFIISEIIVNPIGNFPLNDDWTYGKSVKTFLQNGIIDIGDFPAMSLFSHLMWGALFTKIFSFSFTVLRFSTLVSALISALVLNKLVFKITGSKLVAFIACLTLLFNPVYFNLSNTFMTDVNFITLLLLSLYFAFDFFETQKTLSFIMVFIVSVFIVLLRQYGAIVPFCFSFACLFLSKKRWIYSGMCVILTIGVIAIFKYYENYLKGVLPEGAAYKFSGNNQITNGELWEKFFNNLKSRYTLVLSYIFIYCFPLIAVFLFSLFRSFNLFISTGVLVLSAFISYFLFRDTNFPQGNVFANTLLGAETFFQTFIPEFHGEMHTYSAGAQKAADIIKYTLSAGTIACLVLMFVRLFMQGSKLLKVDKKIILLLSLFFSYIFMLFITDSYYDRYHLPLIAISLLLFAFAYKPYVASYKLAIMPLLLFVYIAVFGTKDYLELNRKRWEAYYFLKDEVGVDYATINGGFEVNCWNEGEPINAWTGFMCMHPEDYKFIIQYKPEAGFKELRGYQFQRYFPYKKDKIYIFIKHADLPL